MFVSLYRYIMMHVQQYIKIRALLYEIHHRTFEVLISVLLKFKSTCMFRFAVEHQSWQHFEELYYCLQLEIQRIAKCSWAEVIIFCMPDIYWRWKELRWQANGEGDVEPGDGFILISDGVSSPGGSVTQLENQKCWWLDRRAKLNSSTLWRDKIM
jgi:hypothetical protein